MDAIVHRLRQATSMTQMRGLGLVKIDSIHRIALRLDAIDESSVSREAHISARAGCRQKPQMVVKFVK